MAEIILTLDGEKTSVGIAEDILYRAKESISLTFRNEGIDRTVSLSLETGEVKVEDWPIKGFIAPSGSEMVIAVPFGKIDFWGNLQGKLPRFTHKRIDTELVFPDGVDVGDAFAFQASSVMTKKGE